MKPLPSAPAAPTLDAGAPAQASAQASAPVTSQSSLPPLSGVGWIEKLTLDNGQLAFVTPPVGTREPRPVVVAVHGAGDRPDWACGGWRLAASEYAFVVCPQGLPMDAQRFAWDQSKTIADRVKSALAATRTRFGPYVAEGAPLYVGFSQGATLADAALLAEPQRFPAVALAEGGYNLMRDTRFLARLAAQGTRRVLIVCGSAGCFGTARHAVGAFGKYGIEALTGGDPKSGHNLNQPMQVALQEVWPTFVEGLPNWRGFRAHWEARRKR
ncbi:MAG: hypothetical protein ACOY0T_06520 [Myxococcota bacterium]